MAWYVACRVRGSLPRWMQVGLRRLRAQPDLRDSERFDRALDLFVRQSTIDHEVAALALFPYEVDPVLNMGDAPGDPHDELPHDGEVPEEILRLAAERRGRRVRPALGSRSVRGGSGERTWRATRCGRWWCSPVAGSLSLVGRCLFQDGRSGDGLSWDELGRSPYESHFINQIQG